jgi:hypothetical protein
VISSPATTVFCILIDTSVWLDLAQDPRQAPLIDAMIAMQKDEHLKLHLVGQSALVSTHDWRASKDRTGTPGGGVSGLFCAPAVRRSYPVSGSNRALFIALTLNRRRASKSFMCSPPCCSSP